MMAIWKQDRREIDHHGDRSRYCWGDSEAPRVEIPLVFFVWQKSELAALQICSFCWFCKEILVCTNGNKCLSVSQWVPRWFLLVALQFPTSVIGSVIHPTPGRKRCIWRSFHHPALSLAEVIPMLRSAVMLKEPKDHSLWFRCSFDWIFGNRKMELRMLCVQLVSHRWSFHLQRILAACYVQGDGTWNTKTHDIYANVSDVIIYINIFPVEHAKYQNI